MSVNYMGILADGIHPGILELEKEYMKRITDEKLNEMVKKTIEELRTAVDGYVHIEQTKPSEPPKLVYSPTEVIIQNDHDYLCHWAALREYDRLFASGRKGTWDVTYSGRRIWLEDPRHTDVCIEDIAHSLSLQCRFGGHVRAHFSVAQHSVLVSELVEHEYPQHALYGLLHDAAETYLSDQRKPVKKLLMNYVALEEGWMKAVAERFSFRMGGDADQVIKAADIAVLEAEVRDLLPHKTINAPPGDAMKAVIQPWTAEESEAKFLKTFRRLYKP